MSQQDNPQENIQEQITYQQEMLRKLIHVGSAIIPAIYLFLPREFMLALLVPASAAVIIIDIVRMLDGKTEEFIDKIFGGMLRSSEERKLSGASFTLLAAVISIFFFSKDEAITALFISAFADPMAALVGRKFGKNETFKGKTVEGSLAFILCGVLIVAMFANIFEKNVMFIILGLIGVCMAAVFEAAAKVIHINDNFSIPIVIGFFMGIF